VTRPATAPGSTGRSQASAIAPDPLGPPPAGGGPSSPGGPAQGRAADAARARWRRWRTPGAIGAFVLLAVIAVAVLRPAAPVTGYLSPQGTDGFGARALADIVAGRGHPVQPVTTVAAAVSAAGPGTTLVITSPYLLTRAQDRALRQTRADLLIVEPDQTTLNVLAPRLALAGGASISTLAPDCPLAAARLAGPASMGGPGLRARGPGAAALAQCYRQDGRPTLVQFRSAGRLVTVLSTGAPLANTYLARQGNAALGINLLSEAGPVVWLVPAVPAGGTPAGTPRSFASLVPLAVYLVMAQLGVALLLTALWRARRLGPLVTEPIPVVVRASETVEGHARLYQSRRARDRVAATLRSALIGRLMPVVGLPANAPPGAVTAALAARSRLDEAQLVNLLYGAVPASDAALVALAGDLDALEEEVLSH
jgi:hypothetical protein